MGAQLPLLREIYAAPLAASQVEVEVETRGLPVAAADLADSAATSAEVPDAPGAAAAEGEAAAVSRMYVPTSLDARQRLVRPLPPPPSHHAPHRS